MNEIIINCNENKEIVIAIVNNGMLTEKYTENADMRRLEGNIYIGKVVDLLPGMQAAFIDIGEEQNAFLHIKDIIPKKSNQTGNKNEQYNDYDIKEYIRVGMPLLVQVKKDKTEKKGARVSTHLNIAGRFIALMPELNFATVSQKIEDQNEIERLKNIAQNVDLQNNGIIFRTSSIGQLEEKIIQDIENVKNLYNTIKDMSTEIITSKKIFPQVIYENGSIINKLLIDVIDKDINRILVNNKEIYNDICNLLNQMEISENIVELKKDEDLLNMYNIKGQLDRLSNRKIWLSCGGFIAIDRTEALTAIDVNTGKFTGKGNLEETVFKVNEQATKEIAKQLKLRDIGGIIIIDYIDMEKKENEEKIVELLKIELKADRAKTQVIGFSPLHLLEMTRKHVFSE